MPARKKSTTQQRITTALLAFVKSIWLFPAVILICLTLLTLFKIHGSSIGVYSMLNGSGTDSSLLTGQPRGVRSDEWLVNTQMIIAQENNNYERVNDNIGNGQDMSLIVDVPYKEWSAVFKPQNLAFLILPFEQAFAFKWWCLLAVLVLACYFFVLELFPRQILRSVLISLLVGSTPMLFWWYQSGTVLPVAYSFLAMFLALRLFKATVRKERVLYSAALAYTSICFVFLLYPPFQIPCFIAVIVFLIGWVLDQYGARAGLKKFLSLWPYFVVVALLTAFMTLLFYETRKGPIQTITHTVYPGARSEVSGGTNPLLSFSSFLSPNLAYDEKAASGYLNNQSEASNFILIAPYLILPALYIVYRNWKQLNKLLWGLVLMNGLLVIFLARMYVSTPWLEPVYQLFLLNKVPSTRLQMGVGFVGLLQLVLIITALQKTRLKKLEARLLSILGALSSFIIMLIIGRFTVENYPMFIASPRKVIFFSAWIAIGVYLILSKRFNAGLLALVIFSIASVYNVHPLYRGLGPLSDSSPVINSIEKYPDRGNWVVLDDRLLINFPLMAGKHSLNSVNFYPQLKLWKELDTTNSYDQVYNRFAHVVFTNDPAMTEPFSLKHTDTILVKFNPCSTFQQKNIQYVLSPKRLDTSCVKLEKSVSDHKQTVYIYRVTPEATSL